MGAAASRVYTISLTRITVTGAITLIQAVANATVPFQIIRAVVGQHSSNTGTQQPVQINRKSAVATVTSFTPLTNGPKTDPAASFVGGSSATGTNASAEGTDTNIIHQDVWNFVNGWLFLPTPKEYTFVDAAGIVGLKFPIAPSSNVFTADLICEDLG